MGLSESKISLLRQFVDFKCQQCKKHEKIVGRLEPHRIKQGGEYNINNLKLCCHACHEIFSSAQRIAQRIQ